MPIIAFDTVNAKIIHCLCEIKNSNLVGHSLFLLARHDHPILSVLWILRECRNSWYRN